MATQKTGNPILDKLTNITSLGGLLPTGSGVDPASMFYKSLFGAASKAGITLPKTQPMSVGTAAKNTLIDQMFGGAQVSQPLSNLSKLVGNIFTPQAGGSTTTSTPPPTTPPPTPPPGTPPPTTGGGTGGGGGLGGGSLETLIAGLAAPTDAYSKAADVYAKELPLIQQRYKSLMDEIEANTEASKGAYQKAETGQIGETQARAAASGVFSGTTELGTEANIRQETARNISILENTQSTQEQKLNAQQSLDELAVAKAIAQLGISEAEAKRTGLKDTISAIIDLQKASTTGAGKILSPSEAALLGVPYGTTEAQAASLGIVPSKPLSATGQTLKANADSGLSALQGLSTLMYDAQGNFKGVPATSILPAGGFSSSGQQFQLYAGEISDVISRLRTGAAINKQEYEFYKSKIPNILDTPDTVQTKLSELTDLFTNVIPSNLSANFSANTQTTYLESP